MQRRRTTTERRLIETLKNINLRCNYSGTSKYYRYGGRGIQNLLTFDDLKFLWDRDKAWTLEQPSIDRLDNDKNYEISNCRFIERRLNIRPPLKCTKCGKQEYGIKKGLCIECFKVRTRKCKYCEAIIRLPALMCDSCRYPTRPCAFCGQTVVRDRIHHRSTLRNNQWFCNKQHHGSWLNKTYGTRARQTT